MLSRSHVYMIVFNMQITDMLTQFLSLSKVNTHIPTPTDTYIHTHTHTHNCYITTDNPSIHAVNTMLRRRSLSLTKEMKMGCSVTDENSDFPRKQLLLIKRQPQVRVVGPADHRDERKTSAMTELSFQTKSRSRM